MHRCLGSLINIFCKERRLYLQRPTTQTVPFYCPHLCVSPCCPVWIDLLVSVSYMAVCQVHRKRKPPWPVRSKFIYLTTSPNREDEWKPFLSSTTVEPTGHCLDVSRAVLCVFSDPVSIRVIVTASGLHAVTIMCNFNWILYCILIAEGVI